MRHYVALIHKDADSDYGVSFPDFPGCVTAGISLDDAFEMATEALGGHVAAMAEEGLPIPTPSSIDTVMANAEHRDGIAVLVSLPKFNENTVHVDVTLPADLLKRIDETASDRSRFIAQAAEHELERR
jgi:predicted RNase H-like HicB family nuclease